MCAHSFGLSKSVPEMGPTGGDVAHAAGKTHVTTRHLVGTPGFIDPLYSDSGRLDKFTDGYAMGVTYLIALTGLAAVPAKEHVCDLRLLHSSPEWPKAKLAELVDQSAGPWPPAVVAELLANYLWLTCQRRLERRSVDDVLGRMEALLKRADAAIEKSRREATAHVAANASPSAQQQQQQQQQPVQQLRTQPPVSSPTTGPEMVNGFLIQPSDATSGLANPLAPPLPPSARLPRSSRRGTTQHGPAIDVHGHAPDLQGVGIPPRPGRPLRRQ